MFSSDILNAQVPSRTSFLGIVTSNSTTPLTYTANTGPVEVLICYRSGPGTLTVNGTSIMSSPTNTERQEFKMYLGVGQTISIIGSLASPDGAFISVRTLP